MKKYLIFIFIFFFSLITYGFANQKIIDHVNKFGGKAILTSHDVRRASDRVAEAAKKIRHAEGDVYVVVESVYSMDGDSAPLAELANFCKENHLILVVDEAHAVGVFGSHGEGLVQMLGLEEQIPIRIITFGKAIGAHGAAVLSNQLIKHFLINFSRSFIYTTALPPYAIQAIESSYLILKKENVIQILFDKIRLFKSQFSNLKSNSLIESDSSIQCVLFPGNEVVKSVSNCLVRDGFDVRPVISPTVKKGKERIRVCLHVFNTDEEIINLANAIKVQIANARN